MPVSSAEIRGIIPPLLGDEYISKKIVCLRPFRRGSPLFSLDNIFGKYIINNFGHGGSGWTLAPGASNYVLKMLERTAGSNIKYNSKITILGSGVIGLFSAFLLLKKGYSNVEIVAESFENLTSHNAGGLIAPVSIGDDPKMVHIINQLSFDSYRYFSSILTGEADQVFADAVELLPAYFSSRVDSGLEPYTNVVMKPAKDVIADFGNGTKRNLVVYDDALFVHTGIFMKKLTNYLQSQNIPFKKQKIIHFDEINSSFIFNCTGLGAATLSNDNTLIPALGHLILLKNQMSQNLQYMMLAKISDSNSITTSTRSHRYPVKRLHYMFPKRHVSGIDSVEEVGVIGGTIIEGVDESTSTEEEFDILLNNARTFYGIL